MQSLSRPGGNITGLSTLVPGFAGKEMQILWEIFPTASKIAVLANPSNPQNRWTVAEEMPRAAQQLGVALLIVEATKPEELDIAFASAAAQHANAIIVLGYLFTFATPRKLPRSRRSIVYPRSSSAGFSSPKAD